MKKLMMIMMCMALLAGCGQDKKSNENNNTTNNNDVTDKNDTTNNTDQTKSWYDRFETGLKDKKIEYSTKTSLDASAIGGAEGYRYTTDNGNIDVYRFEDGESLDKIMQDKKLNINGKESQVEVRDHMVIVSDGLSDDIMNIFRGL